jgi:glycerate dehydrogenase
MRIVILDGQTLNPGDNPWTPLEALGQVETHDRTAEDQIVPRADGADVLVVNKIRLSAETIAALPDLRLIAVTATGYDCVDVAAARRRGIPVANVPIYGTDSVAQHVFALLLHLCGNVAGHDAAVRAGRWATCPDFCFWDTPLVELAGQTLGIVGFGRIGRRVGEIGHALGMSIVAFDQYHGEPPAYLPFAWANELPELCQQSDVITLHCNLTAENAGMVNREFLGHVKPGAVLINTSRGGLVHEADLAAALAEGRLAAAAVDVVSREPIAADNPLLNAPHCVITPHIAWATLSARRRLLATTAENIAAFQAGRPKNVVN